MIRIGFVVSGFIAVLGLLPVVGIPFQIVTLVTGLIKLRTGDTKGARGFIIFGFAGALLTTLFTALFMLVPFDGAVQK